MFLLVLDTDYLSVCTNLSADETKASTLIDIYITDQYLLEFVI